MGGKRCVMSGKMFEQESARERERERVRARPTAEEKRNNDCILIINDSKFA